MKEIDRQIDPTGAFRDRVRVGNVVSRREARDFAREKSKWIDSLSIRIRLEDDGDNKGKQLTPKEELGLAVTVINIVSDISDSLLKQALEAKNKRDNKKFALLFDFSAGMGFIWADLEAARGIGVIPVRQHLLDAFNEFFPSSKARDEGSQQLMRNSTEEAMGEFISIKKLLDQDPTGFMAIDATLRRLIKDTPRAWALNPHLVNAGASSGVKLYKRIYREALTRLSSS